MKKIDVVRNNKVKLNNKKEAEKTAAWVYRKDLSPDISQMRGVRIPELNCIVYVKKTSKKTDKQIIENYTAARMKNLIDSKKANEVKITPIPQ